MGKSETDSIGISDFFTRQSANEGTKVPLTLPDGTETEHWIRIRSVDSDEYRKAEAAMKREIYSWDEEDAATREEFLDNATLRLRASLIISWSFEEKCDEKAKLEMVKEAPAIGDRLEAISQKPVLFIKKKPGVSSKSPKSTLK